MTKTIALAHVLLIAALSLSVALADRMKEHASQDRLSLSAAELLAKWLSLIGLRSHPC